MPGRWLREAALAALLLLPVTGLALLLVRPPLPMAAAERLLQAAVFRLAAPVEPPHPGLVIIGITEETLAAFPYRSPIDRGFLAGLVDGLAAAGVAAIGLDILLDRPTEPAKDAALRRAILRDDPPVVVISLAPERELPAEGAATLEAFLDGVRSGTANLARDIFDDMVRLHVPRHPATGAPSFAAALAQAVGVPAPTQAFPIAWRRTQAGPVAPSIPRRPSRCCPPTGCTGASPWSAACCRAATSIAAWSPPSAARASGWRSMRRSWPRSSTGASRPAIRCGARHCRRPAWRCSASAPGCGWLGAR
jgi:hypothetical protein